METIEALFAFLQFHGDAVMLLAVVWALAAFLALCAVALVNSRIQEDERER